MIAFNIKQGNILLHTLALASSTCASSLNIPPQVANASELTICVVAVILGLVILFYGYRLFKPVLFLTGFVIGAGVTFIVVARFTSAENYIVVGGALLAGFALGLLLLCIIKVGIFILGAAFGFLIAAALLSLKDGGLFDNYVQYTLIAALPLAGGILAIIFEKALIILATSFGGAYAIMASVDRFAKGGFSQVIPLILQNEVSEIDASYVTYLEIGACVILFVLGVYVQKEHTGKKHDHRHRSQGYEPINEVNDD